MKYEEIYTKNNYESTNTSIFKCRRNSMLPSCLESDITSRLNCALHNIFLQKISYLLTKKYFLLNIDGISKGATFFYFASGFQSHFMKHFIIANECFHHGL